MAAYTKFQSFVEAIALKKHNLLSDQIMIALSNVAPVNTNSVLANLTEIAYTNLSSRVVTVSAAAQTAGVFKLTLADLTLTSTGGTTGPFRYVSVYNNTASNKELIGFFDRGDSITLNDGENVLLDMDDTNGVLQIS